jgi:hypothetical protein
MPLATRAVTLGIPPRLHIIKPQAKKKKAHKRKSTKTRKRSASDSEDEDEDSESEPPVKKRTKRNKRQRVETSEDEMESVLDEGGEPVEVEAVDLESVNEEEPDVSINYYSGVHIKSLTSSPGCR